MCDRANTWVFCRDLHLTLRLSRLLQKDLFKGKWSLGKSCFKQNYCSAYHTRFAVFFPLPSCCVSLVSFLNVSQPGFLGSVVYKFHSSWLRLCFLGRIKKTELWSHISHPMDSSLPKKNRKIRKRITYNDNGMSSCSSQWQEGKATWTTYEYAKCIYLDLKHMIWIHLRI